jgi:hypothetical protein
MASRTNAWTYIAECSREYSHVRGRQLHKGQQQRTASSFKSDSSQNVIRIVKWVWHVEGMDREGQIWREALRWHVILEN